MDLEQEVAILKEKMAIIEKDWKRAIEVLKHVTAMLDLLNLEDADYDYVRVPEPPGGMNYFG